MLERFVVNEQHHAAELEQDLVEDAEVIVNDIPLIDGMHRDVMQIVSLEEDDEIIECEEQSPEDLTGDHDEEAEDLHEGVHNAEAEDLVDDEETAVTYPYP